MKTIALLIFGGIAITLGACTHETTYVHKYDVHHRHYNSSTIPGQATTLHNPGAPEQFKAQGAR